MTLMRCAILNPSTLLPLPEGITVDPNPNDEDHNCFEVMKMETSHFPTVSEAPLPNPDMVIFVDGSRYADDGGRYHTGYTVTTTDTVLQAEALPSSMSAQEAELQALTTACKLAKGKTANIHTDSRYAFGVAHDFGVIWKARGFLTAAGTPVKHSTAIKDLMDALLLPTQVAVLKVKAHGKLTTDEAKGNHLADLAAKQAASSKQEVVENTILAVQTRSQSLPVDKTHLKEQQDAASQEERETWIKKGAAQKDGLFEVNKKTFLPRNLYPAVVQWAHGAAHLSKNLMNSLISKYYMAPGITALTNNYCKSCTICAKCNPGRMEKVPRKHLAKPLYPFQRIQIDHIQMPKSGRFEYALVIIDMFSGWPEAFPVTNMTAKTTAKKLLSEIVCRPRLRHWNP